MAQTKFDLRKKKDREFIAGKFVEAKGYEPLWRELELWAREQGYTK